MKVHPFSLRNLSVKTKLYLMGMISLVFMLLVGGVSMYAQVQLRNSADNMYMQSDTIRKLGQIRTDTRAAYGFLLEYILIFDENERANLNQNIDKRLASIGNTIQTWSQTVATAQEKAQVESLTKLFKDFQDGLTTIRSTYKSQGKDAALHLIFGEFSSSQQQLNNKAAEIGESINSQADQLHIENGNVFRGTVIMSAVIILLSLLVGTLAVTIITRSIVRPMKALQSLMKSAGEGDFTGVGTHVTLDEVGQLTQSYNDMSESLKSLVGQVHHSTELVAASSQQLNASSQETSKVTEKIVLAMEQISKETIAQNQSVVETANTIDDMNSALQHVLSNTIGISEKATDSSRTANEGNDIVVKTTMQMNQLQQQFIQLEQVLSQLNTQIVNIGNMNDVVSNIADQTKLLALNASIEAARAGEDGRGFAVVAQEVRKLAEESAQSAQEIYQLVGAIQSDNQTVMNTMKNVHNEFESGIKMVHAAGDQFYTIGEAITTIAAHLEDVSATMQQMSAGSEQINTTVQQFTSSIEQMSQNVQNVASSTEEQLAAMQEVEASSQHLAKLAEEMQESTSRFRI
ncbi:methyl-accepting chemotaxis protein [Paenibacillus sp. 1001270B_150601_E10]|uniref:methyl-accepting chemotaxis protein n=1 Tax=Paenibacillus sp. 1001270B_150601_E10 TaxID=2787079 RepID=UPI00189EE359|nr:methyl-accepting chemotaxis protein [Paenibacillus sp. 1001270B_150601_E10]